MSDVWLCTFCRAEAPKLEKVECYPKHVRYMLFGAVLERDSGVAVDFQETGSTPHGPIRFAK